MYAASMMIKSRWAKCDRESNALPTILATSRSINTPFQTTQEVHQSQEQTDSILYRLLPKHLKSLRIFNITMYISTLLPTLFLLGSVSASPVDTKRQTGNSCTASASVITMIQNNPGGGVPQPPSINIKPALTIKQNDFTAYSNTDDMPNSKTISNNDSGLFYDVEWTIDYGTPGIDGCGVNFGGNQASGTTSFRTEGTNPRTEFATCDVSFDC